MKRITPLINAVKQVFAAVINYFEHGDLVPFIVVVSAWHYSAILREHDHLIAAVSIGTLVDLGHYRWTKAAVRYSGDDTREKIGRWAMVLVMSAIALNYQQRFYNDWWLSVPMPLLIASLAWLNQKDSKPTKKEKVQQVLTEVHPPMLQEPQPIAQPLAPVLDARSKVAQYWLDNPQGNNTAAGLYAGVSRQRAAQLKPAVTLNGHGKPAENGAE